MASLAEIRAKLKQQETRGSGAGPGDNAVFTHWNIPDGSTTVVRFLPDGNTDNTFFWQERAMIKLPFTGVKGDMNSKPMLVQVPCVEMWGDTCPVLSEVREWFKDPTLEDMGRKYWKKRSYIFQGFVNENPLTEDSNPENPIRRFMISPSIFGLIKDVLMDPEINELPTDYERGLDFRITKTTKGQYADYSTSKWARNESALTEEQKAAIETHGLFDLSDFMPKRPGDVELEVIKQMFEASVDGEAYDLERWGQYYRPYGLEAPAGTPSTSTTDAAPAESKPKPKSESKAETLEVPKKEAAKEEKADSESKSADDILAMIRSRQKA